ncbi:MAG TPA: single-stranded DNA-binding protein, partial [Caldithrix abyssi]|nr:single-stranded DNA-binding protein [Caldithrix abyssi]
GRDPDLRYSPSGTAVASFSVATNHNVKNSEGQWETKTEWHNITCFGRTAEFAGEYLKKGRQVYVEGSLRTRSWEDQNGQKHYRTEILANDVQLLGSRAESEAAETTEAAEEPVTPPAEPESDTEETVEPDDLPF